MARLTGRCAGVLGLLGFGNGRRLAHVSFFLVLMGYWVASSSGGVERISPTGLPIVFAAFCLLLYGGIYLLNDLIDLPLDRLHPVKKKRLVASGRIPVRLAWVLASSLIAAGLAASFALSSTVGLFGVLFLSVNALYTVHMKRFRYVELLGNTLTYPLRVLLGIALAGGAAVEHLPVVLGTTILAWATTALRRHFELANVGARARPVLQTYPHRALSHAALWPGVLWPLLLAWPSPPIDKGFIWFGFSVWTFVVAVWTGAVSGAFRRSPRARAAVRWLALYVLGR